MSNSPFRFLHAGDFHLEQPLGGVADVPDHLREFFLEAAYTAAGRVFDAALMEEVAFIVLSGDILHPTYTGPRGPIFLCDQFRRLAEREIPVYWAGGEVDPPDAWPSSLPLPANVHYFPRGRVDEFIVEHDRTPIARLLGTSRDGLPTIRPGDFHPDLTGLTTVAVANGVADTAALQARGISYWALGGRHERGTLTNAAPLIHYCGTPQGRLPEESGVHGCTLVQVDENRQFRTSLIPTDAVRWLFERIVVDGETTQADLENRLRERILAIQQSASKLPLFITWTLAGAGPMITQLRRGRLAADLMGWLRGEYGFQSPPAWSLAIEVEPSDRLPAEWFEQESIRGDFLREIRRLQMNADEDLDFSGYLAETESETEEDISILTAFTAQKWGPSPKTREKVLNEAALLGVALLGGDADENKETQP